MSSSTHRGTALALLLLGASACGHPTQPSYPGSTPGSTADIVPVQGVRVTPQSVQFSTPGETRQLFARISPSNATDQALSWESTDTSVVTVDAGGLVRARGAGTGVFVTAFTHDGRHEGSVNVSVDP